MRNTKIVATIGPGSCEDEVANRLVEIIDVARFNLKHNTSKWHQETINKYVDQARKLHKRLIIMADVPNSDMPLTLSGVDMLALSYIKDASDIKKARVRIEKKGWNCLLVAKIETKKAVENLEPIIAESDAIMIARGDLGKSIEPELVNIYQKTIIDKTRREGKPVIVATEMLMSMCQNPEPTRAEVADVANAIFDGADCLMMSNETAIGLYPTETALTMARIIEANQQSQFERRLEPSVKGRADVILKAASEIIENGQIKGVVVFSQSGKSALKLAGYRKGVKILGVSNNPKAVSLMSLGSGIEPVQIDLAGDELFDQSGGIFKQLKDMGATREEGLYLVVHGENWLKSGSISALRLVEL